MNTFDILTCGSATVDVFAHTDNEIKKIREHNTLTECFVYPVGTKMIISQLHQTTGGGGTNSATACARLGLHTAYIGCLGSDYNSSIIRQELQEHQISFLGHTVHDATGYSVILDSLAHDRTILTYKGANNKLAFEKLHLRNVHCKGLYCSSMMGAAQHAQLRLCAWAKRNGAKVAYNPSSYQVKEGLRKLTPLLKVTDVLIFNKEEAQILLQTKDSGKALVHKLLQYVPTVVITDGPHPIIAGHEDQYYEVHPKKVKVVETTGAGDAFATTVFASLIKGHNFAQSLARGLANSQAVIGAIGAKQGLLELTAMEKYIKRHALASCVKYHGSIVRS